MRLNRFGMVMMVQAPEPGEGEGGGGGGGGGQTADKVPPAPAIPATPDTKPAPEPAPDAKPAPAPEPEKKAEAKPTKGKAREVIATLEQKVAELSQTHEADRKAIVDERWDIALERAGVLPEYRDWARGRIGDVDLKTDAGKAKVDDFVRGHMAMTTRAAQKAADPISAWVDKTKTAAAKAPTSAIANMPREFLSNYARTSVAGVEDGQ